MDEKSAPAGRRHLRVTLSVLLAALCVSLFFIIKLKPSGAGAFVFLSIWLSVPYAAMAALLLYLQRGEMSLLPWCVAVVSVAIGGIYVLVDVIYLHPDAQGAIAVVLTPVLQGIAFLVVAPLAWWAAKRTSGRQA